MTDTDYMRLALELAAKGEGRVNPNPLVGAVIVKHGTVIGRGYHRQYGFPHGEREALASLSQPAKGATLYVTLEPCCHHGKTPPCTDAIIESGIRRVVIGALDPNPLVAGKGVRILREHGIQVSLGVLEEECVRQNRVFFHFIQNRTPYVVMKYAMTMDGKTATCTGESKWITGEEARERVHRDRNRYSAIMAGVGTVLADDPLLTCRIPGKRNPVRVICDTGLRLPITSRIAATARQVRTILATCCPDRARRHPYEEAGCEILLLPLKNGHTDLTVLMNRLGAMGIDSVLLEGGSTLNWSALSQGIVNSIQAYIAPKIFGGRDAPSAVAGAGVKVPDMAFRMGVPSISHVGCDILLECDILPKCNILPESEVTPCLQES